MAFVPVKPFVLRDVLLKISTTAEVPVEIGDFEAHCSKVQFDPNAPVVTWRGLTPASQFVGVGTATWVATLALAQDWESDVSLAKYLHEHEGETIDVTFEPIKGGASFTARLTITPGSIGGDVDGVPTSSVALPSSKPAYVAA